MRTYRLHHTNDTSAFERRLKKAKDSGSQRLLGFGFNSHPPKERMSDTVWAWQGRLNEVVPEGWDEYHLLVKTPAEFEKIRFPNRFQIVIQPQNKADKQRWLMVLKHLPIETLNQQVFLEFEPWSEARAELLTVNEVVGFLYELRYHRPDWKPQRRPGIELWDHRISDNFELESSNWQEKNFHFQNEKPLLSVVIPSYNNKFFVRNVIQHLGLQSLDSKQYEVIVVDDGGTDQTLSYLELFGVPKGLQLKYVYWPRPGLRSRGDTFFRAGLCRNLGVRVSRGESLVFLDSDMLVPRLFLETVLEELKRHDVLQFPRIHIRQEKSSGLTKYENVSPDDGYIEEEEYWKPFFEAPDWMKLEKFWKYTCTYGLAMRRKDFMEAGRFCRFYVSYGFEDTELGYRLAKLGKRFRVVPVTLLHLTSYSTSEYQFSKKKRHMLLRRTAKQFFLNTLEIENFHHLQSFMAGERSTWQRLKKALDFRDRNKFSGDKD
jgi:glycosyltransferase involved in cell wall biosynthesis